MEIMVKEDLSSEYLRRQIVKCYHNNENITLNFIKVNCCFISEDYLRDAFFNITNNKDILKNIKIINATAGIRASLKFVVNNKYIPLK